MEGHHALGPQRVHLLGRGCQAGDDPEAPHSPDTGGARGRPASPLLLAWMQAPRAHRYLDGLLGMPEVPRLSVCLRFGFRPRVRPGSKRMRGGPMPGKKTTAPILCALAPGVSAHGTAALGDHEKRIATPHAEASRIPIKLSPRRPRVDDDNLFASLVPRRSLPRGYHYEATLVGRKRPDCASSVTAPKVSGPRRKGKAVDFHITSWDDEVNSGPVWCRGKASITIRRAKGGGTGSIIGVKRFRFRAKR